MRVKLVAFTERGMELAARLAEGLAAQGSEVQLSVPSALAERMGVAAYDTLESWAEEAFSAADALLFVSACGIAVRTVAPLLADKLQDPAVVCVDEGGRHAVALLSGHVGGANALARTVAAICGAEPVITTATDVNGVFAVDEWAQRQGLAICDREAAKEVSASLLDGKTVGVRSDWPLAGELPEGLVWDEEGTCALGISISLDLGKRPYARTLRLVPRTVTVGMGCRRGTPADALADALDACLARAHVAREAVACLATIDVKADEEGMRTLADWLGTPLVTYSAAELASVEGSFDSSEFVRETVGVDNVCERAACARGAQLLAGKRTLGGATVALAADDPGLSFDEPCQEQAGGGEA